MSCNTYCPSRKEEGENALPLGVLQEDKDLVEQTQKAVEIVDVSQEVHTVKTTVGNVLQVGEQDNVLPLDVLQEDKDLVKKMHIAVEIVGVSQEAQEAEKAALVNATHIVLQEGKEEKNVLPLGVLQEDEDLSRRHRKRWKLLRCHMKHRELK